MHRGMPKKVSRGQATLEYSALSAAILVGAGLGWPFLVKLLDALSMYYASIYYVILSPVP